MNDSREDILKKVDHTLLRQDATREEIRTLCEEAVAFSTASVCIPPRFVSFAAGILADRLPVCTVIGFPLGYATTKAKLAEAEDALRAGAKELDTVIPVGALKDGEEQLIFNELSALKRLCGGFCLKVIVETCLLTREEKIRVTKLVRESGADYIKTSTGFSKAGASVEDVKLFRSICPDLKIKAAGGVRDFEFAERLLCAGADRLGASALVKLCK